MGRKIGLCVIAVSLILFIILPKKVIAVDTSPWLRPGEVKISKYEDITATNPVPDGKIGNRECINQDIVTREAKIIPAFPYVITEQSYPGCSTQALFGLFDRTQNYLKFNGSGVYKPFKNQSSQTPAVVPVPNSNTTLYLTRFFAAGAHVSYLVNSQEKIALSADKSHYKINHPYDGVISDRSGNNLQFVYDSMSFSANGKWMVADIPGVGASRVNLESFDVLPFGPAFSYAGGQNPFTQTAISDDGRYAVVASVQYNEFKLYDLNTCSTIPDRITAPLNCKYTDLLDDLQANVPSALGVSTVRFRSNHTFSFISSRRINGQLQRAWYLLTAPGENETGYQYLGLGDSFASGEGAYQYKDGTDTDLNKCHTSLVSYPYLIASELSLNTAESVACSGAKIKDIIPVLEDYNLDPQAKGKEDTSFDQNILEGFLPGYRLQSGFVSKNTPNMVTVSVTGNDIGFKDKLLRCLAPGDDCFDTYEDRLEIVREINRQFDQMVSVYTTLKSSTLPGSKIYVIGYPQIADTDGSCGVNVHLSQKDREFAKDLIKYLNSTIQRAAMKAGVYYVDTEDAFDGYKLCESNNNQLAMNGLSIGDDIPNVLNGPIANESYHPNAFGHWLLKEKILSATSGLSKGMPEADMSSKPHSETESLTLLNAPKSGRQTRIPQYHENLTNTSLVVRGSWLDIAVNSPRNFSLPSGSTFKLWIHSDPKLLGEFDVDSKGNLDISTKLPEDLDPGFHTLHLFGENRAGEEIDIYKTIYVASSLDDFDGDGAPNQEDPCMILSASGIDIDKDGVDDACDAVISDPPANSEDDFDYSIYDGNPKPPENNPETVAGNEQLDHNDDPQASQNSSNTQTALTGSNQPAATANAQSNPSNDLATNPQVETVTETDPVRANVLGASNKDNSKLTKNNYERFTNPTNNGWKLSLLIISLSLITTGIILRKKIT